MWLQFTSPEVLGKNYDGGASKRLFLVSLTMCFRAVPIVGHPKLLTADCLVVVDI